MPGNTLCAAPIKGKVVFSGIGGGMDLRLKRALLESGKSQRAMARLGGFSERRLSDFVTGWAQPREAEQRVLAELLNTTVKALFGPVDERRDGEQS